MPEPTAARVAAVGSLAVTAIAVLAILVGGRAASADAAPALQRATAPAWKATAALSAELDALRAGGARAAAITAARTAADAIRHATVEVSRMSIESTQAPLVDLDRSALRSQAAWVDAVGSTLANPGSVRRSALPRLAKDAAERIAVVALHEPVPAGTVRGTGHLLAATAR